MHTTAPSQSQRPTVIRTGVKSTVPRSTCRRISSRLVLVEGSCRCSTEALHPRCVATISFAKIMKMPRVREFSTNGAKIVIVTFHGSPSAAYGWRVSPSWIRSFSSTSGGTITSTSAEWSARRVIEPFGAMSNMASQRTRAIFLVVRANSRASRAALTMGSIVAVMTLPYVGMNCCRTQITRCEMLNISYN